MISHTHTHTHRVGAAVGELKAACRPTAGGSDLSERGTLSGAPTASSPEQGHASHPDISEVIAEEQLPRKWPVTMATTGY